MKSLSSSNSQAEDKIFYRIKELTDFYPPHIKKEDKEFFYPCIEYFSQQEQYEMLKGFWEFDRKLIHEKYQKVVEDVKSMML